jgi:SAM-dependent methyltransferase
MIELAPAAAAYSSQGHDNVRAEMEVPSLGRTLASLLRIAPGNELLDLGCGDGTVERLAAGATGRYVGVDLCPTRPAPSERVVHDLREGLGPVGPRPFDLYVGAFGVASHLSPAELRRLLGDIAAHARPGAIVAIEALGVYSLEWPRLWDTAPGPNRTLPYRMATDVAVHPWAPGELARLLLEAGIRPVVARDRTLQAGPKTGEDRYWPGIPALRSAVADLLSGRDLRPRQELTAPLPPLPAGPAAAVHHRLGRRRRRLVGELRTTAPRDLARRLWALEPRSGGGYGHGLLVVGRVT